MVDQERLMALGQIAENEKRMRDLIHGVERACRDVRERISLWGSPSEINLEAVAAATGDLARLVQEYKTLELKTKTLKDRYGEP